jgi:hypothetical protein
VQPGNSLTTFAALGSGTLAFLGAGPVGSLNGTVVPENLVLGNRVQLGDLNPVLVAALVRLAILTPDYASGDGEEPAGAPTPPGEATDQPDGFWEHFLDGLFSKSDWSRSEAAGEHPVVAEEGAPVIEIGEIAPAQLEQEAGEDAGEQLDQEWKDVSWLNDNPLSATDEEERSWALALASVAAVGLLTPEMERRRRSRRRHRDRGR